MINTGLLHHAAGQDRAIDRKVVCAQQFFHLWLRQQCAQKLPRDVGRQQVVAVPGEHGGVENGVIYSKSDKPAEQEIKLKPLHELVLQAHGIKHLQERRAQQPLRGIEGRPSAL